MVYLFDNGQIMFKFKGLVPVEATLLCSKGCTHRLNENSENMILVIDSEPF
jgi:hypothetical protein